MAAETQFTANTGWAQISTANPNLDGTGTMGTVLTGASNGTLVKSVIIKATTSTSQGMIRLFIYNGSTTRLVAEIEVPAITRSSTDESFEKYIPIDLALESGDQLRASTEVANTFNIIAEGLNWAYYGASVRPESTNYTARTGTVLIDTANSNVDGTTGTYGDVITAGVSGSGWLGLRINSITIKAITSTVADGMVRLFIKDTGTDAKLLTEIPVPIVTKSATARSFVHQINFPFGFHIKAGYKIIASTELGGGTYNKFHIMADAVDWKYPA
ncbi:MAG: hypothetical protein J0L87_08085 [Bacteroidetes bacterium]|nr:hypothetical protein [Bacteroidota bacterium]